MRNLLDIVSTAVDARGLLTYNSSSCALHEYALAMLRIRMVRQSKIKTVWSAKGV